LGVFAAGGEGIGGGITGGDTLTGFGGMGAVGVGGLGAAFCKSLLVLVVIGGVGVYFLSSTLK